VLSKAASRLTEELATTIAVIFDGLEHTASKLEWENEWIDTSSNLAGELRQASIRGMGDELD